MLSPISKQKTATLSLIDTLNQLCVQQSVDQIEQMPWFDQTTETQQVDWLILHFNAWFSHHNVKLIKGNNEPEYFPASTNAPARIEFAHGFFNSALHEISHWCIAGAARRALPDLGYWYAPDGRSAEQQQQFEQVEVKPQAIEWLFATAFGRKFNVSLDNLTGESSDSTAFKDHVFHQVQLYFSGQAKLPKDALLFIFYICSSVRQGQMLSINEFTRHALD
ncbi:elongation factor P hydroxylase [Acinetobacter rathckeae]|uniref:elongation factor P hydroxylase n=1 Tax=Acinetobacter rathckeae TaxID=2605272 RepID=UPI0018A263CA|nr:elongation factor P hydroxylase [Acinetobacter rathckeae]MBF7686715.1 elongation factor P hydroxylase [Acinetobacter rathckeae]MBF7695752.1 elongation factor P hydroxylase [Acinetobacter rathckeae]